MCCCFLLPLTSVGESHSLPHASMVCAMSVILGIDYHVCLLTTGNEWDILGSEHYILTSVVVVVALQDSFMHIKVTKSPSIY